MMIKTVKLDDNIIATNEWIVHGKHLSVVHAYMQRTEEEVRNSCEEALTEDWLT